MSFVSYLWLTCGVHREERDSLSPVHPTPPQFRERRRMTFQTRVNICYMTVCKRASHCFVLWLLFQIQLADFFIAYLWLSIGIIAVECQLSSHIGVFKSGSYFRWKLIYNLTSRYELLSLNSISLFDKCTSFNYYTFTESCVRACFFFIVIFYLLFFAEYLLNALQ